MGAGVHNKALDVVYKGRRAVARFSDESTELEQLLHFNSYKNRVSGEYAKHFPRVYTTFDFDADDTTYSGAIIELLEPLPAGLEHDLESMSLDDKLPRSRVQIIVNNPGMVDAWAKASSRDEDVWEQLTQFYKASIEPIMKQMIGQPFSKVDDAFDGAIGDVANKNDFYRFTDKILKALRGAVVPHGSTQPAAMVRNHQSTMIREFYEFLLALEDAGMPWDDLHTGNFMIRPGTGDLVVADPGMFG